MSVEGLPEPQPRPPVSPESGQHGVRPGQVGESSAVTPENSLAMVVFRAEVEVDLETAQMLRREIAALVTRLTGVNADTAVTMAVRGKRDGASLERKLSDLFADEQVQTELQRRLSMPVAEALGALDLSPGQVKRAWYPIAREGLRVLRDVLVVGRQRVREYQNLGSVALDQLEHAIKRQLPGVEWHDKPTMTDIVRLCPDLASVSGAVIGAGGTVQEVLDWNEDEIAQDPEPGRARARQARAREFAAAFMAEQERQGLDRDA